MAPMTGTSGTDRITLDGTPLRVADLVALADRHAEVTVPDSALERVHRSHETLLAARDAGTVYGANTGVGANRTVALVDEDEDLSEEEVLREQTAHGLRLLRSHATGIGEVEDDRVTRAALVVRLNQLLAGGSGVSPAVVRGLLAAVRADALPTFHRTGSVGTGDVTALAELALTLIGELPWRSGTAEPIVFAPSDSLPFMSSSAVTLATTALAADVAARQLDAATVVAALSFRALRGSAEAFDEQVHAARPHPGQVQEAARLRWLTERVSGPPAGAARLQDPFGLRAAPQVHAPARTALSVLLGALDRELGGPAENPLVVDDGVRHHGQFHLATLAWTLDAARVGLHPVFSLSTSRLGLLMRADMTGLPPFLADARRNATSSGLMIVEYVAQDALAHMRVDSAPVTNASVSVSLGLEDHASFAIQSTRLLTSLVRSAGAVLAVELFAAVRALQMAPDRVAGTRLLPVFEHLVSLIDPSTDDRPLGPDIERLEAELPGLGAVLADFPARQAPPSSPSALSSLQEGTS